MQTSNTNQIGSAIYEILSDLDEIRRRVLRNAPMANQKKLYGLTLRQSAAVNQVMLLMTNYPQGITLKNLSDKMQMHPSAASIMVDKMVNKGFLERTENPNDRRTVCIRISAKGKEIITATRTLLKEEIEKYASVLTPEEEAQLVQIAAKLKSQVAEES